MSARPGKIELSDWGARYRALRQAGMLESPYGGPLDRHLRDGDTRLRCLEFDNSAAALRLWNFLLTEEDRLRDFQAGGGKLVGTMKDLGTVPVLVYAFPELRAFYPDGAWWIPCVMELSDGLLRAADRCGINETFCPVRAMVGAFESGAHFPLPDGLVCSTGAVCDDFSAVAQCIERQGHPIHWWEMPHRRMPEPGEAAVLLPGGQPAPVAQVELVRGELEALCPLLEELAGRHLDEAMLVDSIQAANRIRRKIRELRRCCFTANPAPLPALEGLVAEMLAIHYCSDRVETDAVLDALLRETATRVQHGVGVLPPDAVRVYWVNPVADLQVMNLLEQSGGRLCGTDFLFGHALEDIPEDLPPLEALARTALSDPMAGPSADRAERVVAEAAELGAEAVVVSRIPGASHCAVEGAVIGEAVRARLNLPLVEIEVTPVSDSARPMLRTRLEALVETVRMRRSA